MVVYVPGLIMSLRGPRYRLSSFRSVVLFTVISKKLTSKNNEIPYSRNKYATI